MKATNLTKQQIYKAIDELPPESLSEVAQFLEFLKFKQAQGQAIPQKQRFDPRFVICIPVQTGTGAGYPTKAHREIRRTLERPA